MAFGLPKLPGLTFSDPTKNQHHMKSSLRYYQGYRFPDTVIRGPGGTDTDVDSNAFAITDDSVGYDPSLTYGRVKQTALPAVIPHWVHYDKRCLKFTAFFKQPVFDNPDENYRVRVVNIIYFLEDDTLTVTEPRVRNSGLWQGKMVRRGKIPKNDLGDCWHWKDLDVGKDICIYGTVFHTVSCDLFTKMPLTPAQKQKRYREKLQRENPEKYVQMKKKTAECSLRYYRKKTSEYTEQDKIERRQKWLDERKNLKQTQNDKARNDLNNSENIKNKQIMNKLRKENYVVKREMFKLRKSFEALRKKNYRQSKKLHELNKTFQDIKEKYQEVTTRLKEQNCITNEGSDVMIVDQETPMKQTETFIRNNLMNIDESKKQIVKKKLLEHNVLSKSLKEEYKKSVGMEKNILKKIVTNEIVKKYKLKDKLKHALGLKSNIRKNRDRKIRKNKILNEIYTFYNRDDNSRATAGKKECKTKNKVKLQRRYLLTTIKKLHEKYISEGGKVSLSTFKKYRPFNILTPKISDRDTCACVKHSNMAFMVKKLNQLGILESDDLNDIVANLVCDVASKSCMYGLCESCKDSIITANETDLNLNDKIIWPVWMSKKHEYGEEGNKKTSNRMVKTEREGSIQDLINVINTDSKKFLNHSYNISHQYKSYKFCIANLKENETVIHIDFSENYICKMNTEIQAMHFGSSKVQITLHTGVLYIKNEHKPISFCSISPVNIHSPEAIWAHLNPILQYLKEAYPQVNTIHFFSDGPTSQYRNKKNFYLFSQIQSFGFNHATWSIFEASHGKGAADGIGGAIKRTLDSKVAYGEDIPDAKTAFEVLSKTDSAIKVFYIPPDDIKPIQEEIVKRINPLPNTLKIHQVILNVKNSVRFRELSCFCKDMSGKCDCHSIKTHNFEISNEKLKKSRKIQKKKKTDTKKVKKRRDSSSSTSSVDSFEIEYLEDSDATHFSEPEYLEEDYLDEDKGENSEKGFASEEDIFAGYVNAKQERETAAQKRVTLLSEIRNLPCNKRYIDIKQFYGLECRKVDLNFDLFSAKKSLDVKSTEKGDLYTNSVAGTSGVNKYSSHKNQDKPDCCIKYLDSSAKEDRHKNQMKYRSEPEIYSEFEKSEIKENLLNWTTNDAVRTDKTGIGHTNLDSLKINENKRIIGCEESCEPVKTNKNEKSEYLEYKEEINIKYIKINQNVLVRYYSRNNWKYYIGRVEEVNITEDKYTVNFLKTVKNPSLKFVVTKKMDRDIVPSISIVKTIELVSSGKKNEYLLRDNFDIIYFK